MPTINQDYYEEATVLVWRNINKFKFIPTGHFGHAAVMLRGPSLGIGHGDSKYISWWPGEGADKKDAFRKQGGYASQDFQADMHSELSPNARDGLRDGRMTPRAGQTKVDYEDDQGRDLWGQSPDATVSIPGINVVDSEFGLSLRRMFTWYEDYQKNNGKYRLASTKQSCAGVAAVALVEGGGEAFASAPTALILLDPRQVEDYATKIHAKLQALNRKSALFEIDSQKVVSNHIKGRGGIGVTGRGMQADLWDYETWMKQSAVGGSVRSMQMRKIDSALKDYHRVGWKTEFVKKYKCYITILSELIDHWEKKAESDRAAPRAQLGLQIFDVLRSGALA